MSFKTSPRSSGTSSPPSGSKPKARGFFNVVKLKEHTRIVSLISDALLPQCGYYSEFLRNATPLEIIELDVDYNLVDVFEAAAVRQVLALYQKDASLVVEGIHKEGVAVSKFLASELKCRETNDRLRHMSEVDRRDLICNTKHWTDTSNPVHKLIRTCAEIIRVIVGDCPEYSDIPFKFGPGSSTTVSVRTTVPFKLSVVPVCAKEAIRSGAVSELLETIPRYKQFAGYLGVRYGMGHLRFVPKNAKSHRTMIIEPVVNTAVQIGLGTVLKKRFKSVGINLSDQWKDNMERARRASANDGVNYKPSDRLATIDFSSASDLICYYLIMLLFPLKWFNLLSNWRTGTVCYKQGGWRSFELEKFSTMGNGYTFELESIVFYAMALAVIGGKNRVYDPQVIIQRYSKDVSIFGDDLIIPAKYYTGVQWASQALGFKINQDKTYTRGHFYESCGGDFYKGVQIRPFYVKDLFTSARIVGLLNHDKRNSFGGILPDDLRAQLLALIPKRDRYFGPDGYGDGHVIVNDYTLHRLQGSKEVILDLPHYGPTAYKLRDGTNRFYFETLKLKTVSRECDFELGLYLAKMYDTQFFGEPDLEDSKSKVADPFIMKTDDKVSRVRIVVHADSKKHSLLLDENAEQIPVNLPLFAPIPVTEWPYLHIQSIYHAKYIKPHFAD